MLFTAVISSSSPNRIYIYNNSNSIIELEFVIKHSHFKFIKFEEQGFFELMMRQNIIEVQISLFVCFEAEKSIQQNTIEEIFNFHSSWVECI